MKQFFRYLIIFVPLAFITQVVFSNPLVNFMVPGIGLMALSLLLTDTIDALSYYTGPKISAILSATFGNATELIITAVALLAGHIVLVKAAVMGAVLGNLLVVPGLAMLFGGITNGQQHFKAKDVSQSTTMMTLSVAGFLIPTIFAFLHVSTLHQLVSAETVTNPPLFFLVSE